MIRRIFRRVGFERFAIALTGLCIAFLYLLVALDHSGTGAAEAASPADAAMRRAAADVVADAAMPRLIKPVEVFAVAPNTKVADVFGRIGYHLEAVRRHGEVPRVFLATLPEDLPSIRGVAKRKAVFIQTALPLILHVNELILHDRARIKALKAAFDAGAEVSGGDRVWLADKAAEYGLEKIDYEALLRRVDVIPPSLALAQSAEESGWGTSRFAQQGNSLFGQRVWKPHRKGLVPEGRPDGERFRVRAFDHLIDAVKSYARNLNVHNAYDEFRRARAALRRDEGRLDGYSLTATLHRYSERGRDYVETLRAIIRVNGLGFFDSVRLGDRITLDDGEDGAIHGPPDA